MPGHFGDTRPLTATWCPSLISALVFFWTGFVFLRYPGIQNDEALFAGPLFQAQAAPQFRVRLFHHDFQLMLLTYLGTLKTLVYAPVFRFLAPSPLSVRVPVLAIGSLTVALFALFAAWSHGVRAAWCAGLLLATDTVFLLSTCFDWGPVVLQHLLLVSGLLLITWSRKRDNGVALTAAFFCFGLALWDKALFSWMFAGIAAAVAIAFPDELRASATARNVRLAVCGLAVGALPLILYNAAHRFATVTANSALSVEEHDVKWWQLRNTFRGSALLGYMPQASLGPGALPHSAVERASFQLHQISGDRRTNLLEPAFLLALIAAAFCWRTRARRLLVFAFVAAGVAWLAMFLTKGAGVGAHHIVLLWPLPHLFLAVAFAEASLRFRRVGLSLLVLLMALLITANVLVTNQHLYQFIRNGSAGSWTDAIYPLSVRLSQESAPKTVVADWGMLDSLKLLQQGNRTIEWATEPFDERKFADPSIVWVEHTPAYAVNPDLARRVNEFGVGHGYREAEFARIADTHGREVFELFRWVKLVPQVSR